MQRRPLGGTGLTVSRAILGCGSIGGIGSAQLARGHGLSDDEGIAQLDHAVGLGIATLDTANSYAGGDSERVVGDWLRAHPEADVLVATKVGNPVRPDRTEIDLSPGHIVEQALASTERLGRIDLYLSHAPDESTPIEATLSGFADVLERGLAKAIGACNVTAAQLESALDAAEREGLPRYEWVQNEYNLLHRDDERDLLRVVTERGLGYTPFSPLAGGDLAGRYRRGEAPPAGSRRAVFGAQLPPPPESAWRGLDVLAAEARERGVSMAALALAWVLSAPHVTAALVAPRRPKQFDDVAAALSLSLDPDERDRLAAAFD